SFRKTYLILVCSSIKTESPTTLRLYCIHCVIKS
ncbi:unnamed protein product, partial [Allacma fusca]